MKEGLLTATMQLLSQGQDLVTTRVGSVPVVEITGTLCNTEAAQTVNFLRSGCRAVQIIGGHIEDRRVFRRIIKSLELPDEALACVPSEDTEGRGGVIVVTRTER